MLIYLQQKTNINISLKNGKSLKWLGCFASALINGKWFMIFPKMVLGMCQNVGVEKLNHQV